MLTKKHKKTKSLGDLKIFRNLLTSMSDESPSGNIENSFEEDLRQLHQESKKMEEIKLIEEEETIPTRKLSKSLSSYLLVDKHKEKFKTYVTEKQLLEEFNFYELYKKFINQHTKEERNNYRIQIFKECIDENGTNSLTMDVKTRKKLIKKYHSGEENPFKSLFAQVYSTLTATYKTFYGLYKNKDLPESEYNIEEAMKIPQTFDELLQSTGAMKLFSTFVQENFGQNYIDCYDELLKYTSTPEESKDTKSIVQYIKPSSKKNCIRNFEIRMEIIIKDKFQKDWETKLFKFIINILKSEYYPRFINSHVWKNFIKTISEKKENEKAPDFEDVYTVLNIERSVESFSENIEILVVKNKTTGEQFKAAKIISTKKSIENRRIQALNQINHENIVQLIDLFHEDLGSFNKGSLMLVTTDLNESLDKYLNHVSDSFSKLELYDMMIQLLTGLQQFHKLNRHFDIGELTERTIYFSGLYSTLHIDPGFFLDDFDFLNYFEPPEKQASMKSDIFAMGLIFFRLLTLLPSKKVQDIVSKKTTDNKLLNIIRDSLLQPDYYNNIRQYLNEKKDEYGEELINLVLSMIDSHPDQRKDVDSLLEQVGKMRSNLNKFSMKRRSRKKQKFDKLEKAQISIIESEESRQYFKSYLRTEYAVEPVLFYEDVLVFQHILSDQERYYKAQEIFQSYLRSNSELEINVSGKLKKQLSEDLKEISFVRVDIFDEMVKHICDTLLIDTFPRFQGSKIYDEMSQK